MRRKSDIGDKMVENASAYIKRAAFQELIYTNVYKTSLLLLPGKKVVKCKICFLSNLHRKAAAERCKLVTCSWPRFPRDSVNEGAHSQLFSTRFFLAAAVTNYLIRPNQLNVSIHPTPLNSAYFHNSMFIYVSKSANGDAYIAISAKLLSHCQKLALSVY
jgi:hypothetical protein